MARPTTCHVIVRCNGRVIEDADWPVDAVLDLAAGFPWVTVRGKSYALRGYLLGSPNKRTLRFEVDLVPVTPSPA
ncbi:MAG TPA: hypothetical protein VHL09_01675 [Dehalococcoidia bacterium]|nr:hypothetical protein [Dehalococcoidia bacterium]